jgi:hypothetical protein
MSLPNVSAGPIHLGFMTVFAEAAGYVGGFLITNSWGRPLEFRVSSAVNPNRIQSAIYGSTLPEFLAGELIGKALFDKATSPVSLIFTDTLIVLPLRRQIAVPVLALVDEEELRATPLLSDQPRAVGHDRLQGLGYHSATEAGDGATIRQILDQVDSGFDLADPFMRVREAMQEARRMGVASRG